jgi:hypothetical protein
VTAPHNAIIMKDRTAVLKNSGEPLILIYNGLLRVLIRPASTAVIPAVWTEMLPEKARAATEAVTAELLTIPPSAVI